MKLLNRLICYCKGHRKLQRGQETKYIYYLLENSGPFCRGITYTFGGRLYHCSRCGELLICHGVTSWELEDLVSDTLEDLPKIDWDRLTSCDYDIIRLYTKEP